MFNGDRGRSEEEALRLRPPVDSDEHGLFPVGFLFMGGPVLMLAGLVWLCWRVWG